MNRAVMGPAERDREFIAGLAAERPRLHVAKMMRVGWLAAAHQARLLGDIAKVFPVAIATRGGDREDALVDAVRLTGSVLSVVTVSVRPSRPESTEKSSFDGAARFGRWELR